jgi:serine/threonine protein kinase
VATEGDDGDNPPTLPTPEPPGDSEVDDRAPLDLRFELEELRVNLALTDEPDPITVDASGRFQIIDQLGQGAMGTVYRAHDRDLRCDVALKVIGAVTPGREHLRDRLLQEAQALAQLRHSQNVVQVYDIREAQSGEPVVALELVDGMTLRSWQRGDRSLDEIFDAYLAAGRGLAEAHEAGVIHRDFKPDNAMIREGRDGRSRVVVVDFGLAGGVVDEERVVEGLLSPIESTGLGTPEYMAPEQHRRPADPLSDQYAYCVALWEAVDGRRPFETNRAEPDELPPAPPNMPVWLYWILRRGLAWEPRDRFRDMYALIDRLTRSRRVSRGLRWGVAAVAGLGLFIGGAQALQPPPCAEADAPIARVWNDDARSRIEAALAEFDAPLATSTAEHALETLDAVARAWSRESTQLCAASLEGGASIELARREACLETWLSRIDRTVELLGEGDHQLAVNLVDVLDPLIAGADLCRVPPPVIEPGVRALLVEAETDEHARRFEAALEHAGRAVEMSADAPPCVEGSGRSYEGAAANYRLGHVLGKLGRWDDSRKVLRIAADHALTCDDAWTAFDVRTFESFVDSHANHSELARAHSALADARSLLIRAYRSDTHSLRHAEQSRFAGLLAARGDSPDFEEALGQLTSARALLDELELVPLARKVQILHNLGSTLHAAGRHADAKRAYLEASDLLTRALGARHPQTLAMQAAIELNQGLLELAATKPNFEQVDDLLSSAAEHGDPEVAAKAYAGLLQARMQTDRAAESMPLALRYRQLLETHEQLPVDARIDSLAVLGHYLSKEAPDPKIVEEGVAMLAEAVELDAFGRRLDVHYNYALALYRMKRYDEAARVLTRLSLENLEQPLKNAVSKLRGIIAKKLASEGER